MLENISIQTFLYAYLFSSVITAILFVIDKSLATSGSRRISEKNLILASFFCGWPGGLFAMKLVRHKTKKVEFQVMMGLAILANIIVVAWITMH